MNYHKEINQGILSTCYDLVENIKMLAKLIEKIIEFIENLYEDNEAPIIHEIFNPRRTMFSFISISYFCSI